LILHQKFNICCVVAICVTKLLCTHLHCLWFYSESTFEKSVSIISYYNYGLQQLDMLSHCSHETLGSILYLDPTFWDDIAKNSCNRIMWNLGRGTIIQWFGFSIYAQLIWRLTMLTWISLYKYLWSLQSKDTPNEDTHPTPAGVICMHGNS